ncbi:flagellar biosynthesis protein FlhA [Chitinasiproducens palmae]|uniref:Flagellar biosynthesis protein FlhA n=1 Tax=Chitinasiproducens palmae TaxID=1770053 RepID=A0A1H2PLL7_9BURK|nr:flagellar biosynthesis protein FlhA [Chitinasiproducens palmae]SDV46922.1 flagellar biosynthesis protein FlhA [Chitinasiproducens palmae]
MKSIKQRLARLKPARLGTPALVLAIVAMVILPLPPAALDFLFTFNIVLALVVVLVSVSVRRPLDFSAFPTVILAATLLRLSLNVASTRVVLLNGGHGTAAAGQVIEAFGKVVIGGNFMVGLVVFVILMIINFVVVTKGAERISEVSARFTLDALPGKQMAIDADLNAGLINQEQAQQRRRETALEADFYGAMDGASKFVRGDAIAGILVLLINLIGGVAIGMVSHGLSFDEALRLYALLTIGDGLVAQIPALLLAAAAAVIVTRADDDRGLEKQVHAQLLASPSAFYGAAGVLLVLALIPGMPWLVFGGFAAALGYAGWRLDRAEPAGVEEASQRAMEVIAQDAAPAPLDWDAITPGAAVTVRLGHRLLGLLDENQGGALPRRLAGVRASLTNELGFLLPLFVLRDDLRLQANHYSICLHDVEVTEGSVHPDRLMAIRSAAVYGDIDGITTIEPAYGMEVQWIGPESKGEALALGYQVVDCASAIVTHLERVVRDHAAELFDVDDALGLSERLLPARPRLREALEKAVSLPQLARIARALLQEGVALRNVGCVAEALIEGADNAQDIHGLVARARIALRREIVVNLTGSLQRLRVCSVAGELESILLSAFGQVEQAGKTPGDDFPVAPNVMSQLQAGMLSVAEKMRSSGAPPVLLVAPPLRGFLARHARLFAPGLHVLSYAEVPDETEVEVVGSLS